MQISVCGVRGVHVQPCYLHTGCVLIHLSSFTCLACPKMSNLSYML
jgi:hypothetical protein